MKLKKYIMAASAAIGLLAGFSAQAEEQVAKSFLTLKLDDKGKISMELPKELLGREMIMGSAVEKTSNGGDAMVGYRSSETIQFCFEATDSLIVIREFSPVRYSSLDNNGIQAVRNSHNGAITATFPIDHESRDSSFYKVDVTSLFSSFDKRLSPVDPAGVESFGGIVRTKLNHKSELSQIIGVEAFPTNVSVLSHDSFEESRSVLGMKASGDNETVTMVVRRSIILLPEETMKPRLADSRIGVNATEAVVFNSNDRGSKTINYANRWRVEPGKEIVFYLDTLFNEKMAKAITAGVLEWNKAFVEMGMGEVLKVRPYPKDDPEFNANDMGRSCIKYETLQNSDIRNQIWEDPRTGEIIGASMYVPFDVITSIHAGLMLEIGHAVPSLQTSQNTSDLLYEALQSRICFNTGLCLGLTRNQAASSTVKISDLKSPEFTQKLGLSPSIMDRLPSNFLATKEDAEAGVKLIQTQIGPYDKYAINWLYCQIPGAATAEEEKPYLDDLILASKHDPYCFFLRTPAMNDIRYSMDPRSNPLDLGDDPIESARLRLENTKGIISNLHTWLNATDPHYTFRPYLNGEFLTTFVYTYRSVLDLVGGLEFNEVHESESEPAMKQIPADVQKRALEFALNCMDDMEWIDNDLLYRDIMFVRSMRDYVKDILYEDILTSVAKISFVESMYGNAEFSLSEALDMIVDHVLKSVKEGRKDALSNKKMQYMLVGFAQSNSHALKDVEFYNADGDRMIRETAGFDRIVAPSYAVPVVEDHRIYTALKKIRKIYATGVRKAPDEETKHVYEYIVMAIDRYLDQD